jgi:hypothetical protein
MVAPDLEEQRARAFLNYEEAMERGCENGKTVSSDRAVS